MVNFYNTCLTPEGMSTFRSIINTDLVTEIGDSLIKIETNSGEIVWWIFNGVHWCLKGFST